MTTLFCVRNTRILCKMICGRSLEARMVGLSWVRHDSLPKIHGPYKQLVSTLVSHANEVNCCSNGLGFAVPVAPPFMLV